MTELSNGQSAHDLKSLEIALKNAGLLIDNHIHYLSTPFKVNEKMYFILIFLSEDSQWITFTSRILEKQEWRKIIQSKNMQDHELMKILLRINGQHNFGIFALDKDGNIIIIGQIVNTKMDEMIYRQYIQAISLMFTHFLEIAFA